MIVRYCDYYDETRNDPAFYTWDSTEWVATVEIDGRALEAWVVGEMYIIFDDGVTETIVRYTDDLRRYGIHTDEQLWSVDWSAWENNSWIELRDYEGQWIGDVLSGHVYHSVKEAVECMMELLEDPEFLSEYPCLIPADVVE